MLEVVAFRGIEDRVELVMVNVDLGALEREKEDPVVRLVLVEVGLP